MKSSNAAAIVGLLLAALALLGASACASGNATVGVGWGVSVGGGPYGYGVRPTVGIGVYGRPY